MKAGPAGLILASASSARRLVLENAGVAFRCLPSAIDENPIKESHRAQNKTIEETALSLSRAKALDVSGRQAGACVIGADQIMTCDGAWFDKPADIAAAAATLRRLRGRAHRLISAVSVCRDGAELWHYVAEARLTMRDFSDAFLDRYLENAGPEVLESVGAYRLEGTGAQLFAEIKGDYFTILGLPLLPLLTFLRGHGLLEA